MFEGIKPVLVTRQETVILPRAKPIVAKCVLVAVKVKYNEPKLN